MGGSNFDSAKDWLNKSNTLVGYDEVWFKPNSAAFKVKMDDGGY